jgi:Mce-associated membrane protein
MTTTDLYDVLDVDPASSAAQIRAAWRSAVADLDPTDRRFRVYNQAAEVLLDPARRAAYDAEHPVGPPPIEPSVEQLGTAASARLWLVPGWVLVVVAALLAGSLVVAGVLLAQPSDTAVVSDTEAAQAAAERAIVPLLSYDAHHLDESAAAAHPFLTSSEQAEYDKLFAVIRQNAPRTGTVVRARYLASGIVRSGTDRVDVFVLVNQVTRNRAHPEVPVVYRNQVTVSMARVGGEWLVDGLTTNGAHT